MAYTYPRSDRCAGKGKPVKSGAAPAAVRRIPRRTPLSMGWEGGVGDDAEPEDLPARSRGRIHSLRGGGPREGGTYASQTCIPADCTDAAAFATGPCRGGEHRRHRRRGRPHEHLRGGRIDRWPRADGGDPRNGGKSRLPDGGEHGDRLRAGRGRSAGGRGRIQRLPGGGKCSSPHGRLRRAECGTDRRRGGGRGARLDDAAAGRHRKDGGAGAERGLRGADRSGRTVRGHRPHRRRGGRGSHAAAGAVAGRHR